MSKRFFLALVAAVGFSAVGCAATDDAAVEGDELVAASEEGLAKTGPTYKAGTDLVTTAALNLREGPSTNHKVLRVIPNGARVEVRKESGANAWVAVTYKGFKGWAHTSYLKKASSGGSSGGGSPSGYNATRANKLANTADRVNGAPAGGWCAREVSDSVEMSGIVPKGRWRRNNAIDISENMASDTKYTKSVGFKRVDVAANKIPKGSIIGWRRGQCGYHSTYGHIEIAIDSSSSRACSDYCGSIKKTCGKPYVFMPTSL